MDCIAVIGVDRIGSDGVEFVLISKWTLIGKVDAKCTGVKKQRMRD